MLDFVAADKEVGLTCGEVIDTLSAHIYSLSTKHDFEVLSGTKQRMVAQAYRHNRSRANGVPGGQLGEGMRRLDFLGTQTVFGGIEVNERVVRGLCGDALPCTFVLKCQHRYPMTAQEVAEAQARAAAAARAESAARSERRRTVVESTSDEDGDDDDD